MNTPGMIRPWLLITFIVVFLGGGGYLGWWWWNQSQTKTATPTITTPPPPTAGQKTLSFEVITKGQYGGQTKTQQTVIADKKQLKKLWDEVNAQESPAPSLPEIDFSKNMVIAVVGGGGGGGDSIEITKITELNNTIEVAVKEVSAGKGCLVPAVITNSYHIVKLQKSTKEIKFKITPEVTNCSG